MAELCADINVAFYGPVMNTIFDSKNIFHRKTFLTLKKKKKKEKDMINSVKDTAHEKVKDIRQKFSKAVINWTCSVGTRI